MGEPMRGAEWPIAYFEKYDRVHVIENIPSLEQF
jgi:hypothetical protein